MSALRHLRFEQVNFVEDGFVRSYGDSRIAIVGCGGVGSVVSELLVRSGFCNLVLIDFDLISELNLGRQIFYENQIGESKVLALGDNLKEINHSCDLVLIDDKLDEDNIDVFFENCDLIIDATDDFEVRRLINRWSQENKKTWIYNGAIRAEAVSCIFWGDDANLFDKLFVYDVVNENASEYGVLPSTTYLSGSLCFNNVLKFFMGKKENCLVKVNLFDYNLHKVKLK